MTNLLAESGKPKSSFKLEFRGRSSIVVSVVKKILRIVSLSLGFLLLFLASASAGPGDYYLRLKGGPSFELNDWKDQARLGGEFEYDLGYGMGFNQAAFFGISDTFRFDLIPSFRYTYLYVGPGSLYGLFGVGVGFFDKDAALDLRMGTGISLPLGDKFEFNSDVNLFVAPMGMPSTPVTLDWFIGFGVRFH